MITLAKLLCKGLTDVANTPDNLLIILRSTLFTKELPSVMLHTVINVTIL